MTRDPAGYLSSKVGLSFPQDPFTVGDIARTIKHNSIRHNLRGNGSLLVFEDTKIAYDTRGSLALGQARPRLVVCNKKDGDDGHTQTCTDHGEDTSINGSTPLTVLGDGKTTTHLLCIKRGQAPTFVKVELTITDSGTTRNIRVTETTLSEAAVRADSKLAHILNGAASAKHPHAPDWKFIYGSDL